MSPSVALRGRLVDLPAGGSQRSIIVSHRQSSQVIGRFDEQDGRGIAENELFAPTWLFEAI
jgi:hypothetical protein